MNTNKIVVLIATIGIVLIGVSMITMTNPSYKIATMVLGFLAMMMLMFGIVFEIAKCPPKNLFSAFPLPILAFLIFFSALLYITINNPHLFSEQSTEASGVTDTIQSITLPVDTQIFMSIDTPTTEPLAEDRIIEDRVSKAARTVQGIPDSSRISVQTSTMIRPWPTITQGYAYVGQIDSNGRWRKTYFTELVVGELLDLTNVPARLLSTKAIQLYKTPPLTYKSRGTTILESFYWKAGLKFKVISSDFVTVSTNGKIDCILEIRFLP